MTYPDDLKSIDAQIAELLKQRAALNADERVSRETLESFDSSPLGVDAMEGIFREIELAERQMNKPVTIAYLGPKATFTHQAAAKHFGRGANFVPMDGIAEVFEAVCKEQTDFGVVPVENSTEGAVRITYDLFPSFDLRICGEIQLAIHHNYMVSPNAGEITRIYSHRQVFGQCRNWISKNFPKCELIETASTSDAAARAAEDMESAALGGELAAEAYGLNIVHPNIEDHLNNTTRFLVLSRNPAKPTGKDKTSVMFAVKDRVGVLYDALLPFKAHNVNMIMIESRPSKNQQWEYVFFVDLVGHHDDPGCSAALMGLEQHCRFVKILGSYPMANGSV
jgi:chorismate mutase/prephenate dehydratase